ncbi:MAG: MFS transporter, partial [Thermoprotei archaeon]
SLIFANNNAILTDAFPPTERGRAIGINQVVGIMGSVVGLTVGGVLTQTLGWRSIFWINIPVGGFSTIWAYFRLRELSGKAFAREGMDLLGNLLFAPGVGLILYALTFGAFAGWSVYDTLIATLGLSLVALFVYMQTRVVYPMMDLRLFKNRVFLNGIISNLFSSIARGGVALSLSIFFQGVLLYDAYRAGILMLPYSLAFVAVGPLSGYLSDRYGPTGFVTAGLVVGSAGLILLAIYSYAPAPAYTHLVVGMVLTGAGNGMFVAPNIASIMNSVQPTRRGVASGMATLIYNVGSLFSVSLIFIVLATVAPRTELQSLFAGLPVEGGLNERVFGRGVSGVYLLMGLFNLLALVPSTLRLKR